MYVALVFIFMSLSVGLALDCPDKFINLEDGCYMFSINETNTDWLLAAEKCAQLNASLLSIETEAEALTILSHLAHLKSKFDVNPIYWLSGSNTFNESNFLWTSTWKPFSYINWCSGEPNNVKNIENCMGTMPIVNGSSCWNDMRCSGFHVWRDVPIQYICETAPIIPCNYFTAHLNNDKKLSVKMYVSADLNL